MDDTLTDMFGMTDDSAPLPPMAAAEGGPSGDAPWLRSGSSPLGGVMTDGEDGAISGELTLRLRPDGDTVHLEVAYAETEDWYTVHGSPLSGPLDPAQAEHIWQWLMVRDPGIDENGNPRASSAADLGSSPQ